jgi:hypothetical protein
VRTVEVEDRKAGSEPSCSSLAVAADEITRSVKLELAF